MDALTAALLHALAQAAPGEPQSLPRLGKRLGQGASVLMRALAPLGEATLGGVDGAGWVRLWQEEGRWCAQLTPAGRAQWLLLGAGSDPTQDRAGAGGEATARE